MGNNTRTLLRLDLLLLEAVPSELLTPEQSALYAYLKEKLRIFEEKEIEVYRRRTRGLPKYEHSEPDIAFYAKLEKRNAQKGVIGGVEGSSGAGVFGYCLFTTYYYPLLSCVIYSFRHSRAYPGYTFGEY